MKVFMCGTIDLCDGEGQALIQSIIDKGRDLEQIDKKLYESHFINSMDIFRSKSGVPNKILSIAKRRINDKWCLLVFDHKPMNKTFDVSTDDSGRLYIEVP